MRTDTRTSLFLAVLLTASTAYLTALLFGFVFGVGDVRRHHVESATYIFAAVALTTALMRRLPGPGSPAVGEGNHSLWLLGGFLAAAILLYANALFLGLFSDDFVLARRALAGDWLSHEEFFRPLPLALWSLLLNATSNPAALHLLNIGLHGVNAALVSVLALRVGFPRASALAAGMLFLVFPGSVEAVVWPSAVPDLLVTASALAVLLLAARRATAYRVLAAAIVLAIGLLSKESAIAVPLLVAVLWLPFDHPHRSAGWRVMLAGLAVCVIYAAVRMAIVAIPDSYVQAPSQYLIKELMARPFGTLTLPWSTTVFRSWPAIPFAWAVGCVAGVAAYAWGARRAVPIGTSLRSVAAVLVAVVPVYSMLFITPDLENGRYLYLSTAFWVLALVGFASTAEGLGRVSLIVLSAALVVGALGVQWHLAPWRDAARLRERVLTAAGEVLQDAPCRPVSFAGAPDSVRGAYVFRNGLAEAIAFRTDAVPARPSGDCSFLWNGSAFQRAANPSAAVQATFAR